MILTVATMATALTPAYGAQPQAAGGWGKLQAIPFAKPRHGARVGPGMGPVVSCASPGDCAAGGSVEGGGPQAFIANELRGIWKPAEVMPGTRALDTGGDAEVTALSCPSVGNCSAGGDYSADTSQGSLGFAFVASEVNGTWQPAEKVGRIGSGGRVLSVSCTSAGSCTAVGTYTVHDNSRAFLVNEVSAKWQPGQTVKPPKGRQAELSSVSCSSPGNCIAGGGYGDERHMQAMVMSEIDGSWQRPQLLPGSEVLNHGAGTEIDSVSCTSAGNCTAAGNSGAAMVATEVNGRWQAAQPVPGVAPLSSGNFSSIDSVSCASPGNCAASGIFSADENSNRLAAFVVSETGGVWKRAKQVTPVVELPANGPGPATSVSCASPGNCAAAGAVADDHGFLVSDVNGNWQQPRELPQARIGPVSCPAAGKCVATGFTDGHVPILIAQTG